MANSAGNRPQLCPHGVLGKRKCRACQVLWEREWLKKGNNREKGVAATARWRAQAGNAERCRASMRKRCGIPIKGGISPVGVCPLCLEEKTLVPDHDHVTQNFRGWICGVCNRSLGVYEKYRSLNMLSVFEAYIKDTK